MPIRIFIDQGHNPGLINAGASGNGLLEADVTYQAGIYLKELFDDDCRFEVRLSRNSPDEVIGSDTASSLRLRVEMANEWPADYFWSLHANANVNPLISGSEIYVYSSPSTASRMAEKILASMAEVARTKDNGVRVNPNLYVLRNTTMPANLIELAYLTNEEDADLLKNDLFLFSLGIYVGFLRFLGYL